MVMENHKNYDDIGHADDDDDYDDCKVWICKILGFIWLFSFW